MPSCVVRAAVAIVIVGNAVNAVAQSNTQDKPTWCFTT